MTFLEAQKELEACAAQPKHVPGLEAIREGLSRIGYSARSFDSTRVIVVAGTNGKGSVCAGLEALLLSAGQKVGLYTSPHLVRITERFRLNGTDISEEGFCEAYDAVRRVTRDLPLTQFEILTLMAVHIFSTPQHSLDWMILEVGLGGAFDATNAVPHSVNILTALGMDHTQVLGSTIQAVARNKFGVVGEGSLVIHAPLPAAVKLIASETAARTQSRWIERRTYEYKVESRSGADPLFFINTCWGNFQLPLPGRRGAENLALSLTAFEALGFHPSPDLLKDMRWPGRMEKVFVEGLACPIYFSGDHNPQGMESLIEILSHYAYDRLHIIVGVCEDKDCDGVLSPLFSLPRASVYLTETPCRSRKISDYDSWLNRASGASADSWELFKSVCSTAGPDDKVVVTGSLYLIGELQKKLRQTGGLQ